MRIGLYGPYGFGNLGDAAIQEAAIQGLRRHVPDVRLWGICLNPANTEIRHRISAYPIFRKHPGNAAPPVSPAPATAPAAPRRLRSGLKRIPILYPLLNSAHKTWLWAGSVAEETAFMLRTYRFLRNLDILVISGSGQLDEYWGGPFHHPLALCKWVVLARAAGCRVAFVSVGSGSLDSPFSRVFARIALVLAHYKSFRDPKTLALARSLGTRDGRLIPDLAYSLRRQAGPASSPGRVVGINPMAYFDPRAWPEKDASVYAAYVAKLAEIGIWLQNRGYILLLFANEIYMDAPAIDDVISAIRARGYEGKILRPAVDGLEDLLSQIALCDVVIATRFHGELLSFYLGKPTISISYHPKMDLLAREMGQADYVVPIDTFGPEDVERLFTALQAERGPAAARLETVVTAHRERLEEQYRMRAGMMPCRKRASMKTGET